MMLSSKRLFDVTASSIGLITTAPLLALIALLIKWDSPGPVLYRGARTGRDGQEFRILKFRTMTADAARRRRGNYNDGDPRVTRVGRVLRAYKLDELPQLWNVLRGEMSLVGPRPEDPRYVQYYTPAQRAVLRVPPGITSAASVRFRHEERMLEGKEWEARYLELLARKLDIDLAYLAHRRIWTDLKIIIATFLALFRGGEKDNGA